MATEVTIPQLGESVTEGTVTRWLKLPPRDSLKSATNCCPSASVTGSTLENALRCPNCWSI